MPAFYASLVGPAFFHLYFSYPNQLLKNPFHIVIYSILHLSSAKIEYADLGLAFLLLIVIPSKEYRNGILSIYSEEMDEFCL